MLGLPKKLSINARLNLLVSVSGVVAMLLACAAFAVNDFRMIRASKIRELSGLAEVMAAHGGQTLVDGRSDEVAELIAALRREPAIRAACVYDTSGNAGATYFADGPRISTPPPGLTGYRFTGNGYLDVTRPIVDNGEELGSVCLRATTSDLQSQMARSMRIVAVIMLVSLCGSLVISQRLQRAISVPIRRLARTAQQISQAGDYSIRVHRDSQDELGTLYNQFNGMLDRIEQGEKDLREARGELERHVEKRTRQLSQANLELSQEVIERNRAEKELETIHQRLVEAARHAGMAEIATGVLHNVGNVLNSINVSATLIADQLRASRLADLERAVEMIDEHETDLATFLVEDDRGKLLPDFLGMLSEHLQRERETALEELAALSKNIDHVKAIVAMQQSYAGVAGVVETVSIAELVEDALNLSLASLEKHGVEIVREYADLPDSRVEKQKLLQILVNLISNAKDSLIESNNPQRRLMVRIVPTDDDLVRIEVSDNGVGIPADRLTRIFSHGFTTKQHGHGFGLHTSANSAREMSGELTVASDGPQRGATFTIEIPFAPVEVLV